MDYYDLGRMYKQASEEVNDFVDLYEEFRTMYDDFYDTVEDALEREYNAEWNEEETI